MTTMSTVVVLQARMGSRRLPGKVMRRLAGRPLVEHCLQRLIASDVGPVVLATTATSADDVLVEVGAAVGVEVVRGPEHDVLGRFARVVDRYPVRVVIRATADNPAVDVESPRRVLSIVEQQSADYVVEDDLPYGAAVEAVRVEALLDAYVSTQGLDDREHVTTYVKRMTDRFRVVSGGTCIRACAGKARSRGTRCRDVIFETLFETLWVSNPIRPRSAASRNRVMRGPGVTPGAKRSQGARRPRD